MRQEVMRESLRYLGFGRKVPDEAILQEVQHAIETIYTACNRKYVYQIFPVLFQDDSHFIIGNMKITSKNLGKNLKGCQQAVVFAATLGLQADVLVKRASRSGNVSQAVIFQAAQAAIIEEYCDCCQKEIQGLLERQKQYLRPRFSPGYGDFTIEHQRDLTRLLNTPKTIGLTLSDHFILIPTKSVTAIMGITKEQQSCPLKGCESCEKTDCQFRRG
ncbi:MAG: Vitamin B12 dependent methionine synthase activation subunit [Clostridiales bacterium]|nr:Vitamin B12 dependent methionine synthase activation subunit [Clostridiales bacterium]